MSTTETDPLSNPATDLASARTGMALERTLLAEDRTLMAILRTSLSLISFGFTIYQFLGKLALAGETHNAVTRDSARNFGATLIISGIVLLVFGLYAHYRGLMALRARRGRLFEEGLLRTAPAYRPTATGVVCFVLLVLGIVAVVDMLLRTGPLQ
jgi:putative membrane protein